ncbi:uncharacterized protein C6orf141 homolog [Cricetulus griseus]|uniref:Uncharacterized protein C6orf141 homolog n=1 Tax=Cricetulus griseus TaxID=10029 RepID=A0A061IKF7_CRIGR|nr:uncharacterized protein C6orf141 homolog [Cricetulus griseus]ERE87951.1 hypothetical protein H671_1g3418 [Cricetulus griseus]
MNDPLAGIEPGRSRRRAGCSARGVECGPPLDPGSRDPTLAGTDRDLAAAAAGGDVRSRTRQNLDCQSWVREKVLFLLHPERWLGKHTDPACPELADSEDLPPRIGDRRHSEPEPKLSRRRIATVPGAQPGDPAATPRSVLVRIVDYQETQEVLQTAWTKGRMTTRTEERSVTAVTFRTQSE